DVVKGIAMNAAGDVYAMGETGSHTFPSTPPFQRDSGSAIFVAKLSTPALVGAPAAVSVPPSGSQLFTATGGNPPYTFSLVENTSGATIAPTGLYQAGPTALSVDVIEVRDRGGLMARMNAHVSGPIVVTPSEPSVAPQSTLSFTATGGTGTGFVWSFADNMSGGTIDPATGVYVAGADARVFDRIEVRDSLGNLGSARINVGGLLAIAPASPTTPPRGFLTLTATGGAGGYTWSMEAARSGGAVDPASGAYRAGATGGVIDRVNVTDSLGAVTGIDVAIGPAVTISPASLSLGPSQSVLLHAAGGSNRGWVWSLLQNGSGATLSPNGELVVGTTPSTDIVTVRDDLENTATATITVTAPAPPPSSSESPPAIAPSPLANDGGCGCRTSAPASTSGPLSLVVLGALAAWFRSRRSSETRRPGERLRGRRRG
ncbi:MAG: hypothetical protein K0S65_4875, partial [Labilithrix sp.]|nr:hypothetical protein [Labilithrix sp.]